jgi:hypothetical protein
VASSTREISGMCSLLVRAIGYKVDENLNLRLGGAIRGKGRILDEKEQRDLMSDSELQGSSPACVD